MKPLLIVNPSAGGGRAGRTFASLRPIAERVLGPLDVRMTESAGHAIVLARTAASEGCELVVAVGGDGTLHEVANGVLSAGNGQARTAVGFIAQGTGGDFRKSLGIPHRLDRYLAAIASGREKQVDAARAVFRGDGGQKEERWFVNILSAGLGGKVDRFVRDAPRMLPPTAAYVWASARALAGSDATEVSVAVEQNGERTVHRLDAWVVAVCNGTTFGSGMRVAPMAKVDDGRLEVIVLSSPSKVSLAVLSQRLYAGSHIGEKGVLHTWGERVEIAPLPNGRGGSLLLDIDGEPLGRAPVTITIARGALRIRA